MVAGWGTAAAGPHSAGPPAGPPAHWSEISQEKEETGFRRQIEQKLISGICR